MTVLTFWSVMRWSEMQWAEKGPPIFGHDALILSTWNVVSQIYTIGRHVGYFRSQNSSSTPKPTLGYAHFLQAKITKIDFGHDV